MQAKIPKSDPKMQVTKNIEIEIVKSTHDLIFARNINSSNSYNPIAATKIIPDITTFGRK